MYAKSCSIYKLRTFIIDGILLKLYLKKNKNYCEIYIKSSVNKIIKSGKKKIYHNKRNKVWGVNINPEFPKKSHIIINNNFDRPISVLTKELKNKIIKLIK